MPEPNKTTPEHFEIFKAECLKWIDRFGLKDFRIGFNHGDREDLKGCLGGAITHTVNRTAEIVLCVDWGEDETTEARIRQTAFHEICEVMLCPLRTLVDTRYISPEEVGEQIHVVIRRMENAFCE